MRATEDTGNLAYKIRVIVVAMLLLVFIRPSRALPGNTDLEKNSMPHAQQAQTDNASLALRMDTSHLTLGSDIVIHLTLTNTGSIPLWINERLAVNIESAPAAMREVWFEIQ